MPISQGPFQFSEEALKEIPKILKCYPEGREKSAVLPLLYLVQKQAGGWIPRGAIEAVAKMLSMAPMRVEEVVSFYTLFNSQPMGKHRVKICRTTSCWLSGSDLLLKAAEDFLGIQKGETTRDELFTLQEVECLGACANAPVVKINEDLYEDLDTENFKKILGALKSGCRVNKERLRRRKTSEALAIIEEGERLPLETREGLRDA